MASLYVQGEDCLYLNIWKADEASAEKKPVMVFDEFDWEAFPQALIVEDGKLACDTIEDRITEVKGLLDYMLK